MAQPATSAQREPSMEEILASIRRIIEDNEPARPEPDFERYDAAIGPAANDPARSEAFGSRSEDAVEPASISVESRFELPDVEEPTEIEPELEAALSQSVEQEARWQADSRWDVPSVDDLPTVDTPGSIFLAPELDQPKAAEPPAPARIEPKPSILSEQAERQVAAAFGELSEAFAASRRRSFDEIAEEMMRPMLQDWLDNNLPTLVERLVREEIERIARGS